ncbi:hypothetical protein [Longispora fulva]|uniref:Lipocalin-like domain-containing protein n=1 Tax=Longispora fulva TaxID=619741 RepID=A0A8J7GCB9_9ACTN|nr:hypothetical protein [Longispora fulva]
MRKLFWAPALSVALLVPGCGVASSDSRPVKPEQILGNWESAQGARITLLAGASFNGVDLPPLFDAAVVDGSSAGTWKTSGKPMGTAVELTFRLMPDPKGSGYQVGGNTVEMLMTGTGENLVLYVPSSRSSERQLYEFHRK